MEQVSGGETIRAKVLLDGTVQGVGLRYYTQEKAIELGLTGFVRNLTDGRVEVITEGPADKIEDLLAWFQTGSPQSKVDTIALRYEDPEGGFSSFSVRT